MSPAWQPSNLETCHSHTSEHGNRCPRPDYVLRWLTWSKPWRSLVGNADPKASSQAAVSGLLTHRNYDLIFSCYLMLIALDLLGNNKEKKWTQSPWIGFVLDCQANEIIEYMFSSSLTSFFFSQNLFTIHSYCSCWYCFLTECRTLYPFSCRKSFGLFPHFAIFKIKFKRSLLKIYHFVLCVFKFLNVCMCTTCVPVAPHRSKEDITTLELKWQMALSHPVCVRNPVQILSLSCWPISPVHCQHF